MKARPVDTQVPPTSAAAFSRGRRTALFAVVAVVVVIGGFFLARALYWALLQPTPDFPSLATTPDPSLTGTVAFFKPGADRCVYLVAASGGEPEELTCGDGLAGGELTWRDDGRLQSTTHPGADSDDDPLSWIIDPATGNLEEVPTAEIPPYRERPENARPGPNGEEVTCKNGGGKLTLSLTVDGHSRTLLSTGAPSTYCMHFATWNEDGSWFVVKDDLDRLLLVTTAEPSSTRLLVDGGYSPAVTGAELIPG